MSKIKIKNFGPIKKGCLENDGWMDIKKVTVFIGNQGSGKSTVAKLISTFTWLEKKMVRGDYLEKWMIGHGDKRMNPFLKYHRIENYLKSGVIDCSEIQYAGDAYSTVYTKDGLCSSFPDPGKDKPYPLPQIMYVPAERSFIAYVKTAKELKLSSPALTEFLTEFENAKNDIKGLIKLPVNNTDIEYDKLSDTLSLTGEAYKVKLDEASSGFQSLVPLYLVSGYLADSVKKQREANKKEYMSLEEMHRFEKGVKDIWNNDDLTNEQKKIAVSVLSAKFNKTAFINIVEEPELNLFPSSQQKMLNSLLEFNNMSEGNKLIMTTHSPYLINYLTLAVKAHAVKEKIPKENWAKLEKIVPVNSTLSADDLVIYELDEKDGSIKKLPDYNGLPSDENYLNNGLEESNELFARLQEIEKGWR